MTKIRSSDGSNMDDQRGRGGGGGFSFPGSGGGGGGFPIPGGMKAGGGIVGIIIVLAVVLLPRLLGGTDGQGALQPVGDTAARTTSACVTDLEQTVCGVTNDVQAYWKAALPKFFAVDYQQTKTLLFDAPRQSGCGPASPETGPFYCPADALVYIDLGFMQQLEEQFIAGTSDLAEQYIVAHEYGHHVQNLLGTNEQVQRASRNDPSRANQYSVALELQADCYAGVWVGDVDRRNKLDSTTEIQEAIRAAEGVGDDRIQQATTGRIDPESWTHGSAEQRRTWFMKGFTSLDPRQCDTFAEVL